MMQPARFCSCANFAENRTLLRSRSVVPTMEDFDPALFMTVLHSAASFNDIRNGLESLDGAKANQVRTSRARQQRAF